MPHALWRWLGYASIGCSLLLLARNVGSCQRDAEAFHLIQGGDCWWIGDCLAANDPKSSPDRYYTAAMELGYSRYLAEAFLKWRTAYQAWWYGVSNHSQIPAALYEAKRQAVVALVNERLRVQPADQEALHQRAQLEALSDVLPGSPMGLTVLNDMAVAWPRIRCKRPNRGEHGN